MSSFDESRATAEKHSVAARQLLDHPAFQTTLRALEEDYVSQWRASAAADAAAREKLYFKLNALSEFVSDLEAKVSGVQLMDANNRTFISTRG